MLTASQIEAVANSVSDIYENVEKECIKSIVDHITAGKRVTQASVWQMKKLNDIGYLRRDLVGAVKKQTALSFPEVEKLLKEALDRSVGVDTAKLEYAMRAGNYKDKFGSIAEFKKVIKASERFQRVVDNTMASVKDIMNITGTRAIQASVKAYADAINTAYLEMATGNYTYEQAVERAVGRIGKSGIKIVDSKDKATSGEMVGKGKNVYTTYAKADGTVRVYPLDSAIRRDLTTTINRACGKLTLDTCGDLGTELVETSWHIGARPEHELWQGRIFSLNPKDTRYPYFYAPQEAGGTGYGEMLGLCGINCYHSFNPYFEGSPRSTDENKPTKSENDKAYKEQQTQRSYERSLRSLKREQMAYVEGSFIDKAQETQRRINDLSHRYKQFLKDTGRTRVSMLDKVSGYKRISTKAGATIPQPTSTAPTAPPTPRVKKAKHVVPQNPINFDNIPDSYEYASANFAKAYSSLPDDEKNSVYRYTGSSYSRYNLLLREGEQAFESKYGSWGYKVEEYKKEVASLKKALEKNPFPEDAIVHRGAGGFKILEKNFGLSQEELLTEKGMNFLVGKEFADKGFSSTAIYERNAWSNQVMMHIICPKGTKGMWVDPISANSGEMEVILQCNTKFRILKVEKKGDYKLWLTVLAIQ